VEKEQDMEIKLCKKEEVKMTKQTRINYLN